ncbi:hypothetical protein ACTFIY_000358 [Dictyostelium cf. discoideum]
MNDAEKQIVIVKLNKLDSILEERISIVIVEIQNQEIFISENIKQLVEVTDEIVKKEEEFKELMKRNQDLQVQLQGYESQIQDYIKEIGNSKQQISEAHDSINGQKPRDDFWSNLNRGLKPFTGDIPGLFSSNIRELENKIKNLDSEIINKSNNIGNLQIQKGEVELKIRENEIKTKELILKREKFENDKKELGKTKTLNGDFKLKLENLNYQCKSIIEAINIGIELLDIGINKILEIEENVKILFSSNGLTLTY